MGNCIFTSSKDPKTEPLLDRKEKHQTIVPKKSGQGPRPREVHKGRKRGRTDGRKRGGRSYIGSL